MLLDLEAFDDEQGLHRLLAQQLELGPHDGHKWHALRDRLLLDVPRPVEIVWLHSDASRIRLGEDTFDRYLELLLAAQEQDVTFGFANKLMLRLA